MLILQGIPPLGSIKQRWGEKNKLFEDKCVNISKTVRDVSKVTIND